MQDVVEAHVDRPHSQCHASQSKLTLTLVINLHGRHADIAGTLLRDPWAAGSFDHFSPVADCNIAAAQRNGHELRQLLLQRASRDNNSPRTPQQMARFHLCYHSSALEPSIT